MVHYVKYCSVFGTHFRSAQDQMRSHLQDQHLGRNRLNILPPYYAKVAHLTVKCLQVEVRGYKSDVNQDNKFNNQRNGFQPRATPTASLSYNLQRSVNSSIFGTFHMSPCKVHKGEASFGTLRRNELTSIVSLLKKKKTDHTCNRFLRLLEMQMNSNTEIFGFTLIVDQSYIFYDIHVYVCIFYHTYICVTSFIIIITILLITAIYYSIHYHDMIYQIFIIYIVINIITKQ